MVYNKELFNCQYSTVAAVATESHGVTHRVRQNLI